MGVTETILQPFTYCCERDSVPIKKYVSLSYFGGSLITIIL